MIEKRANSFNMLANSLVFGVNGIDIGYFSSAHEPQPKNQQQQIDSTLNWILSFIATSFQS